MYLNITSPMIQGCRCFALMRATIESARFTCSLTCNMLIGPLLHGAHSNNLKQQHSTYDLIYILKYF